MMVKILMKMLIVSMYIPIDLWEGTRLFYFHFIRVYM